MARDQDLQGRVKLNRPQITVGIDSEIDCLERLVVYLQGEATIKDFRVDGSGARLVKTSLDSMRPVVSGRYQYQDTLNRRNYKLIVG